MGDTVPRQACGTPYRSRDGRAWSLVGEATHTETGQKLVVLREQATGRLTCGSLAWFGAWQHSGE